MRDLALRHGDERAEEQAVRARERRAVDELRDALLVVEEVLRAPGSCAPLKIMRPRSATTAGTSTRMVGMSRRRDTMTATIGQTK